MTVAEKQNLRGLRKYSRKVSVLPLILYIRFKGEVTRGSMNPMGGRLRRPEKAKEGVDEK